MCKKTQIKLSCISNYELGGNQHILSSSLSTSSSVISVRKISLLLELVTVSIASSISHVSCLKCYFILMWVSDINECSSSPFPCHVNAQCNNTIGSYRCACNLGYTGNGTTCTGTKFS